MNGDTGFFILMSVFIVGVLWVQTMPLRFDHAEEMARIQAQTQQCFVVSELTTAPAPLSGLETR